MKYLNCMSIAGSDPSGGAGIQADLKTFAALGCFGQAAVTAITVQSTLGVRKSVALDADLVSEQVEEVWRDRIPEAVKIGLVPNAAIAEALARLIEQFRPPFVVWDPVLAASSGKPLVELSDISAMLERLTPVCTLLTPNLPEALAILNTREGEPRALARQLSRELGGISILLKGGHAGGPARDVLFHEGRTSSYTSNRISTLQTHGTGCTLSSAVAAFRARGLPLPRAVSKAKQFVTRALLSGRDVSSGRGTGGLNHFFAPQPSQVVE